MNEALIQLRLAGAGLAEIRYFESIDSTNDYALKWAAEGAADRSVVIANHQTAGRGRMKRRWITEPGAALAFSLILRPTLEEGKLLPLFSPLGAVAVRAALERYGVRGEIKWPNDVLLGGKKTAGILLEAVWSGDRPEGVVIGIGVNVAPQAVPPAEALHFPATSLESVAGKDVDRLDLLYNILVGLLQRRPLLRNGRLLREWEDNLAFKGEWVQIEQLGGSSLTGRILGLESDGSLLIEPEQDKIIRVAAGDLHLRPWNGDRPATPGGNQNVR